MRSRFTPNLDSATTCTILALLFTVASQQLFTQQTELWSELTSWIILSVFFVFTATPESSRRSKPTIDTASRSSQSLSLWGVALLLGISSFCRAEVGLVVPYPILTPLLLAAETFVLFEYFPANSRSWHSTVFLWLTITTSILGVASIPFENLARSAISSIAVGAELCFFVCMIATDVKEWRFLPRILDFEEDMISFVKRNVFIIIVAIAAQTGFFGFTSGSIFLTLASGIFKALSWFFVAQAAKHTSWIIAPIIHTVALLSALDPYWQPTLLRAFVPVIAGIAAMIQIMHMLPKDTRRRPYYVIFSIFFLLPLFAHVCIVGFLRFDASWTYSNLSHHPVEKIIEMKHEEFNMMLQTQSQSYSAVEQEYRRRYRHDPPPHLNTWYDFAVSNQSPVIDEFDSIHRSVSPFWKISGKNVSYMMEMTYAVSGAELWLCEFKSATGETTCQHPRRTFDRHISQMFNRMLGGLKGYIPDVKFLVNHLDEPRVLLPHKRADQNTDYFEFKDLSRQPTWATLTQTCTGPPPSEKAPYDKEITYKKGVGEAFGLPFITSHHAYLDLCSHPEYKDIHGLFQSPSSFALLSGLVPVLSSGAPSAMGDIVYPSPAYIEDEFQYNEAEDVEWANKRNNVYWAGSTTGGIAASDGWRNFHRQRFVTLARGLKLRAHIYIRKRRYSMLNRARVPFINRRLFDVAFTRIFQCDRKFCRDQQAYFHSRSWADKNRPLQSRFAFDMDGNGISGRYYQLLASRSVPLKQTLMREWHDDRLVPWVHYIPVSQTMEELPELVSYMTASVKGQGRAHQIAEQGRAWYSTAFRDVDMTIYLYRLFLELARLQDPNREASV